MKRSFDDEECFSHFTGVSVDGKALDKSAYKAEKGSTVVTIAADALDSLSEGDHTVTVEFDDGEAVVVGDLPHDVADGRGGAEVDAVARDADGGLGQNGGRGEQKGEGRGQHTAVEKYIHGRG